MSEQRQAAIDAVLALVNAARWSETMEVLEECKAPLWSAEADELFAILLEQHASDAGTVAKITWQLEILQAARAGGMEAAFARAKGRGARFVVEPETLQLLQTALESGEEQQLNDVLDRFPYLIPMLEKLNGGGG